MDDIKQIQELVSRLENNNETFENTSSIVWAVATEKNKPYSNIKNVEVLLEYLNIDCSYNEMSKRINIETPNSPGCWTLDNKISDIKDCARVNDYPTQDIPKHIDAICRMNSFHPVCDWITSKPWDGVKRLENVCNTITSSDEYKNTWITKWMVQCITAIFTNEPVKLEYVLVFRGDQGIGKTSWFKNLAPSSLQAIKDGVALDPSDKDSVTKAISYWIVELGELDSTFRKSDISRLKAFLSEDHDNIRTPYDIHPTIYKRRTCFCGTVNDYQFLVDSENRRFLVVEVDQINNTELLKIDTQQVWAEVYEMYKSGQQFWLTYEEESVIREKNKQFEMVDPIQQLIDDNLNPPQSSAQTESLSCRRIMQQCGKTNCTKVELNHLAQCLRRGGWKQRSNNAFRVSFKKGILTVIRGTLRDSEDA